MKKEFVIGVTGASGICYARRLLDVLCTDAKVHIIVSDVAGRIASHECVVLSGFSAKYHDNNQMFSEIASGSYRYDGMVVIPCSQKTLAAIAHGYADNLITRTADVCLKERRKCILVTRETPLSGIHLKNMLAAHEAGAVIMPASPGFYNHPKTVNDLVDMVVSRVLDHLGVEHKLSGRWGGILMREFIEKMRVRGLVTDVDKPCSTDMEAAKMAAGTNNVLFFRNLGGARAVMNVTANRESLAVALGINEEEIVQTLAGATYEGKVIEDGTLKMEKPDLSRLPVLHHFPKDAGKYITSGIVFARYGGVENASIHRMLVLDDHRVAARLVEGRHTHVMLNNALAKGDKLPIAVTIGTHPAVTFASCTRVPEGKELSYAAELLGGEIRVKRCSNGVLVPEAEIVLEGFIGPEVTEEGPFVDITGTYDPVRRQPVIEFTGMHLKRDFIYHGLLPGGNEHKVLMGAPYEPKIFRAVAGVTQVKNVLLTRGGCGYLHAVIQIRKSTQGDAKNAIMAAFAAHTSLKHVIVVDEDIDITNPEDIEYALATRVSGDRDIMVITGVRGSSLDPCQLEDGTNVKIGVDATMVLGREEDFRRATW